MKINTFQIVGKIHSAKNKKLWEKYVIMIFSLEVIQQLRNLDTPYEFQPKKKSDHTSFSRYN